MKEEINKHKEGEPRIEDEVNNFTMRVNPKTGKKELFWGEED